MDVFELRNSLVQDYEAYISSFINIRDARIGEYVDKQISRGLLWPDPLIQLNPSFKPGRNIDELISEGILHPECSKIFKNKKEQSGGKILRLHQHQEDAIRVAHTGQNYILTTGTGSGKSLAYIIPIVNHVLRRGSDKGIQAIIVYPMNALANSQLGELEKFINLGYPNNVGKITFARFTGQESDEQKNVIRQNPPDILLTNYVMLELLLTRPEDRRNIIGKAQGLQYLVLDELHTYRGRQGADVAILLRRLREAVNSEHMQCVGTSATLASEGTYETQRQTVADVASTFFGTEFHPENIIGETLERMTDEHTLDDGEFDKRLITEINKLELEFPNEHGRFIKHPVTSWIESTFGVAQETGTERLVRAQPISITGENGASERLAKITNGPIDRCEQIIKDGLMMGYRIKNPDTGFPVFAFRLHQFISPGDTVYASLEDPDDRYITVNYQQFVPGDRDKILLPLVFCRECGQEYYNVKVTEIKENLTRNFELRDYGDMLRGTDAQAGYLYIKPEKPWPVDEDEIIDRLPDEWLELHRDEVRVKRSWRKNLPKYVRMNTDGVESEEGKGILFSKAPFRFCLNCGVSYGSRQQSDFGKLAVLSAGGRSTSTTILGLSTIRHLQQENYLEQKARKLLSFMDNRQDAALQAGHFNDFVETSLLRAALYQAVDRAGENGLRYEELTQQVAEQLNLDIGLYARQADVRFAALQETNTAFRDVLGYRLYRDLRRGWRVTSPNLEQSGLLRMEYLALDEVCTAEDIWEGKHPALVSATSETRKKVSQALLDHMRRELAIQVRYLDTDEQERVKQRSGQRLIAPWAIDENERLDPAAILYPRGRQDRDYRNNTYLSGRSGYGLYLNKRGTFEAYSEKLDLTERGKIILEILDALSIAGIVEVVDFPKDEGEVPGYQLKAAAMIWKAGDGETPFHDPIRVPQLPDTGGRTNPFFVKFYKNALDDMKGLRAREHTAQVPYGKREEREDEFRDGKLPIMFCSPTMELGIDISQLNVVNMRNVPPTPANYAQRSGRAGRSGQPALVFTYCAKGSPHDQYFFKRQVKMVAGVVAPPRLELANADLVRSHIQAVWLAETHQKLGNSLKDILDLAGDPPSLDLIESIQGALEDQASFSNARSKAEHIFGSMKYILEASDWFNADWLTQIFNQIPNQFEKACDRWRDLYKAALHQREQQDAIIRDATRDSRERKRAKNLRREAENQLELLLDSRNVMQSDFYSYRYFASEGFLPGYNFPRLPLSAYIPARRLRTEDGDYLSRPRFMAVSEFGPRSVIYHEGSRYEINRVIMQVGRVDDETATLATERVKICPSCGYLHQITSGDGIDLCEHCKTPFEGTLSALYRMQNVSTRRRDRINSDEEERFRLGYEIQTSVRFHQDSGHLRMQQADLVNETGTLARISYGDAATIWRINLGWRRREKIERKGFVIDIEQGYWETNKALESDVEDPMGKRAQLVIPFVEDHKNSLLFEPTEKLEHPQMASLAAALKTVIQIEYQLEDNELAVEPLPTDDERNVLLFFESAEGGAGVLRQLVRDARAFARLAKRALALCHFDPDTAQDLEMAEQADEACEAACYDCLMSYYNQRDHRLLDRHKIKDILLAYQGAEVKTSPVALERDEHYRHLGNLCQSDLEEKWLEYIQDNGYRLPSSAQQLVEACKTRPDFIYEDELVAIYVDGYHHLNEERRMRDADQQTCLENMGYIVLRFGVLDDWGKIFEENTYVFGKAL